MTQTTYRKKLIEVALPLAAINEACRHETSVPRRGHPSTMHLWWARRPLAACRAVIFTSLVDDPAEPKAPKKLLEAYDKLPKPETLPEEWDNMSEADQRRERLFAFIGLLVKWESTTDETIIGKARELILLATDGKPPPLLDPFCGGGSIPLEGQRLGLEVYASDLNPVAVLITKALVEIPPKFAGRSPVNPDDRKLAQGAAWKGAAGLAADVRWYGKWMRDRAWERIGHLYPKGPKGETVIAWLWARTVRCPNPACGAQIPLLTSYVLSAKNGRERYLHPNITRDSITFEIAEHPRGELGDPKKGNKRGVSGRFECLVCGNVTTRDYVSDEGEAGRLGTVQTCVVYEGDRRRLYLPPDSCPVPHVQVPRDTEFLEPELAPNPRDVWCRNFGLTKPIDLFTPRQLVALTTFSDLVGEARELTLQHAREAGAEDDGVGIADGGTGATAYADAVATYLAFAVDKAADWGSTLCSWITPIEGIRNTFSRQALPMVWDFAETNPLGTATGNWFNHVNWVAAMVEVAPAVESGADCAQLDAADTMFGPTGSLIATDPPYYDNIGYADLSDFFFVWLRRSLRGTHHNLFATLLTPKELELIATPYRFDGSKKAAEKHFEEGLRKFFGLARMHTTADHPMTLFYAFKQSEQRGGPSGEDGVASTGWEKMLGGLTANSLRLVGTWPVRTERAARPVSIGTNALASSVILVCRPLRSDAAIATRREFQARLRAELPNALRHLTGGHIAPVDLAQSAIGPGMAVFSSYSKVVEADGTDMSVRTALALINDALANYFAEQDTHIDPDTQFCVGWFEQYGFGEGPFGDADNMARARNIGVEALDKDGVLEAKAGKVRLLPVEHYEALVDSYDPATDTRRSVWEACHYLVAALSSGSEASAARLARRLGGYADDARELAYRLYDICDRKGWPEPALGYNALVASWPEIQKQAAQLAEGEQAGLI